MPQDIVAQFDRRYNKPIETGRQVANITQRNAIDVAVRWEGMLVYVVSEGTTYALKGGVTNGDWVPAGQVLDVTVEDNLTSFSTINALSANQGRVLKGLIDNIDPNVDWGDIGGTLSNQTDLQSALNTKLDASQYTAADVLAKIITVDGPGSGLDADLLDGAHGSQYLRSDQSDTMSGTLTVEEIQMNQATNFFQPTTNDDKILFIGGNGAGVRDWSDIFFYTGGVFRVNGNDIWHAGNLDPNDYVAVAGDTMTGGLTISGVSQANLNITNGFIGVKQASQTYRTLLGTSATANNFLVGGSTADASNVLDVYLRIRKVSDGDLTFHESGNQFKIWHAGNDGSGSGLDADTLDGVQGSGFLRSDASDNFTATTLTIGASSTLAVDNIAQFRNVTRWDVSFSDTAHQRADARDDVTTEARLHWYGVNDSGSTGKFKHAWYDGSRYINVDADNGAVIFSRTSGGSSSILRSYFNSSAFANLAAISSGGYLQLTNGSGGSTTILRGYGNSDFYGGNIIVHSGTVTATNFILSSDRRLKTNIKNFKPTNKIETKWRVFDWKDGSKNQIGLIAQELQVTNPEFVVKDQNGYLSIKTMDLLMAKIAEIESRLDKQNVI